MIYINKKKEIIFIKYQILEKKVIEFEITKLEFIFENVFLVKIFVVLLIVVV